MESANNDKFSHERLIELLDQAAATLPDLDPKPFLAIMLELVKLFGVIGSAIAFAFKDITSKVEIVKKNYETFPEQTGGIISFIEMERDMKLQKLNGENPKEAPDPKWKKYESTSRTVYRLLWFLEFISLMIISIEAERSKKISECGKYAYDTALAPHHPFAVRMAAKTGLSFSPNREKFLKEVFPANMTDEEKYQAFKVCGEKLVPVRDFLRKYYEDNKLTDLP